MVSKSPPSRQRRRVTIRHDLQTPRDYPAQQCAVAGCKRLTGRASGEGFSETYCPYHIRIRSRHGSTTRPSYSKAELAPFYAASSKWLKANRERPEVLTAIRNLEWLMATSGRPENAFTMRGVKPSEKARIALACIRHAGTTGERLLRIVLTIKAAARELGPRGDPEFITVQIAKRVHRLIPATRQTTSGIPFGKPKRHRQAGRMLRILGERIEDHAASAVDHMAIQEVLDIKNRKETASAL